MEAIRLALKQHHLTRSVRLTNEASTSIANQLNIEGVTTAEDLKKLVKNVGKGGKKKLTAAELIEKYKTK